MSDGNLDKPLVRKQWPVNLNNVITNKLWVTLIGKRNVSPNFMEYLCSVYCLVFAPLLITCIHSEQNFLSLTN